MAEALLGHLSHGNIDVASAGSQPEREIHPMARHALQKLGIPIGSQHPKSLSGFLGDTFDHVITVCDRIAERCPVLPGDPERIQWNFDDPAARTGTLDDRKRAFDETATHLVNRMRIWMALPNVGGSWHA
jgi:protein-tyrosine-phosphatase